MPATKKKVTRRKRTSAKRRSTATPVVFRVAKAGGAVEAVMCNEPRSRWNRLFYSRVGQHGEGDSAYVTARTRPAKPREYATLAREMRRIGYKLRIVKRLSCRGRAGRVD